jgi:hypothetical protein
MLLVPIHPRVHVDTRHAGIHGDVLLDGGIRPVFPRGRAEGVLDAHHCPLGAVLDHAHRARLLQIPNIFVEADLPRVLGARHVFESLQQIAAPAGRDGLMVAGLVDQAGDAPGFRIDIEAEKLVLDRRAIHLERRLHRPRIGGRNQVNDLIPHCRHGFHHDIERHFARRRIARDHLREQRLSAGIASFQM